MTTKTLGFRRTAEPLALNADKFVPGRQYVVFNRFDGNYLVLSLKGGLPKTSMTTFLNSPELAEICKPFGKPVLLSNDDSFFERSACLNGEALHKWDLSVYPHSVDDKTYWTLHYL